MDGLNVFWQLAFLRSKMGLSTQGGKPVPWGRYPYLVSIRTRQSREHICGGTLIAKDLVLTAAHCVHEANTDAEPQPFLRIGGTDLEGDPDAEVS